MKYSKWPQDFPDRMRRFFVRAGHEDELEDFFASFDGKDVRGMRLNGLKISNVQLFDYQVRRVPWCDDGYYISDEAAPGRHPFHKAGLFYLQEPSAMLPAFALSAKPGEKVLDLCASPGGKALKIAADMKGEGLLMANDVHSNRARVLRRNVENAGCTNCIVTNEFPERLATHLPGYFDRILVDAPCSGEGMFRKDPSAMKNWMKYGPAACAPVQKQILDQASLMLRPGGVLVYSTCTFSPEENEDLIQSFLEDHPNYRVCIPERLLTRIEASNITVGFLPGKNSENAMRIFPHRASGEGHFCAVMEKIESDIPICSDHPVVQTQLRTYRGKDDSVKDFHQAFKAFAEDLLHQEDVDHFLHKTGRDVRVYDGHVYTLPQEPPPLQGLNLTLKGHYAGFLRSAGGRVQFHPSHALALSLPASSFCRLFSVSSDDPITRKYLNGETLTLPDTESSKWRVNGYVPIAADGHVLGWGKINNGPTVKNLYPPGWVDQMVI